MKRVLALFLSLVMVFQMLPATVLADGNEIDAPYSGTDYFTITFVTASVEDETQETVVGTKVVAANTAIGEAPAAPDDREGYVFDYWDVSGTPFTADTIATGDMKVTAVYVREVPRATFTYEAGEGGTVSPASETVELPTEGETAAASGSTATAAAGYIFTNWTDAAGTVVSNDA